MPPRSLPALALLGLTCALAGCGNSRTPLPNFTRSAVPDGFTSFHYQAAGIAVRAPRNWSVQDGHAPLVAIFSSGNAIVAVWRYSRAALPPHGRAALAQARTQLIALSRRRDPRLQVIRSKLGSLRGDPSVEVDALERINGQLRRVRSVHVFVNGAEVVLEEYAPFSEFHRVDHLAFSPIKRSLRLAAGA